MGRPLLRDEVPVGPCKVRALFSWSGETPRDLGFVEGDIIEVLNTGDGDWWTGKLKRNKLVGIFPRNFVEYVDEKQQTMSAALSEKVNTRSKLTQFTLESSGDNFDFSSFSLADLQIPDPSAGAEESALTLDPKASISSNASKKSLSSHVPTPTLANSAFSHKLSSSQTSRHSQSQFRSLSPLTDSTNSNRSTKSAKEILDDITKEINSGFLDDINLDAKPDELRTPELTSDAFGHENSPKRSEIDLLSSFEAKPSPQDTSLLSSGVPTPPPHKVSVNSRKSHRSQHSRSTSLVPGDSQPKEASWFDSSSSLQEEKPLSTHPSSSALTGPPILQPPKSSALTGPDVRGTKPVEANMVSQHPLEDDLNNLERVVTKSPDLDHEIPFDPKSFRTESSIGDHIGSHFDTSAYDSNLGDGLGSSKPRDTPSDVVVVQKTRGNNKPASTNPPGNAGVASIPQFGKEVDQDPKKSSFFQKLFPKNSQTFLRRSFSRSSHKSSKSTRSVGSKLKGMKSMFSFGFTPDDSLYPTNTLSKRKNRSSFDASSNMTPLPEIKKIETPPRSALSNVHLPASLKPPRNLEASRAAALNKSTGAMGNAKEPLSGKWVETRRNLYRAKTLTDRDVQKRRQELELQGVNSDNLVETLNHQNLTDFHDYRLEDFEEVDQAVRTMSTWPQLMTPSVFASSRIGRHFGDPAERIRAIFLLCATRIQHVAQTAPGNNVMQSRQATPSELASTVVAMCSSLDIECVAIEGHIRKVDNQTKTITSVAHAWNAVQINGEWRLLDTVTAASGGCSTVNAADTSLIEGDEDDDFVNLFYFLTPPSQLIFTHVPKDHHQQFCEIPLPTSTASLLPLASPAAFAYGIGFDEFWLGMTRLSDLEVAELSLYVPDTSKDLVALVDGNKPALAQPYWNEAENSRHVRIKAFVPPQVKQTLLSIYVVPKKQSSHAVKDMELLWTVELRHVSGGKNNEPFDFVGRYAVPTAEQYDLYVVEPQCRTLGGGDTYTFKIESFDAHGKQLSREKKPKQPKVAIQSPSGRVSRLVPFGTDVHDTFRATVKTLEVGTWRAVVRANENESWVPFAEWFCS